MKLVLPLCLLALSALAQLRPFNTAGVTMGHHHFVVPDPAAQARIWVDAMGGQASGDPSLRVVQFPGAFLMFSPGAATLGMEGSAIESLTFVVKDLSATQDRLKAAGVKFLDESKEVRILTTEFPDGLKVQFWEDATLNSPIEFFGIELATTDPDAERLWWTRAFGAETEVFSSFFSTTAIPGEFIIFRKVDSSRATTVGRALDHTGVNVKNVNEYCTKLAGMGIVCERPAGTGTPIAMVTSPAGVRVEINQGLEAR